MGHLYNFLRLQSKKETSKQTFCYFLSQLLWLGGTAGGCNPQLLVSFNVQLFVVIQAGNVLVFLY